MIKEVQIIGSGGAFDELNSSFLIKIENDKIKTNILYDCGYNIFSELKRLEKEDPDIIKNTNRVIISHQDDDHMGSLKTFLYYRYFIHGLKTTVITDCPEYLKDLNKEIKGSKQVDAEIIRTIPFNQYNIEGVEVIPIEGNHHIPAKGVIFKSLDRIVFISGDTKASEYIEKQYNEIKGTGKINELLFHDYSFWDAPSRQVHACKSDIKVEYSREFLEKTIMYHNDKANLQGKVYKMDRLELDSETMLSDILDQDL